MEFINFCDRTCSCTCTETTQKKCIALSKAVFVRLLLISHNILAAWRVTVALDNGLYWLLTLGIILIAWEGQYTILKNDGIEWKWVCPCFFFYLATTLPSIWLLEISQMNKFLSSLENTEALPSQTPVTEVVTPANTTAVTTISTSANPIQQLFGITSDLTDSDNAWVVVVEETLVYLIVLGRWLLPRGEVTREALSDLLLDYLAMASDIMELFALFDQDAVRGNREVTYAILTIWSISFIQFIPVMLYKRKYRTLTPVSKSKGCIHACGENFVEIIATCMAVFLQDGPFLILRLCIISYLNILTYSLMFFVVKNIMVIVLLTYKLIILCIKMPCCYRETGDIESVVTVDLNVPIKIPAPETADFHTKDDKMNGDVSIYY